MNSFSALLYAIGLVLLSCNSPPGGTAEISAKAEPAPGVVRASAPEPAPSSASDVLTPHLLAELRSVGAALASPDGEHVAYTLLVPRKPVADEDGPAWSELHVLDVASGQSRPFVTGKVNVGAIEWTADGRWIAFLAKRGSDKETALWIIPIDGGEARKAAELASSISGFSLAPDGKRVALLGTEPDPEDLKKEREQGFSQEVYEEDWKPVRVWIATLFGQEKPAPLAIEGSVRSVEWNPAADELALAVTPTPAVDDEYMRQRIAVVDVGTGGERWAPAGREGKLGALGWSPDGRLLAFITAADRNDPFAARLAIASAAEPGGVAAYAEAVRELRVIAGDVAAFAWGAGNELALLLHEGVATRLLMLSADGKLAAGPALGGAIPTSLSRAGSADVAALVASAPEHPSELFLLRAGSLARATTSNPALAGLRLAPQEVVRFRARDGLELEGLLIRPLDGKAGQRYPLILVVHGGPESHYSDGWLTTYSQPGQIAAACGFAVFHPNYRGSTGRGVEFSKLSQGDPAGKEFDDLIDSVDHLIELGLVDKDRVGVTGGSYGGYATAWCSTRYSERFAAGVMMVGISDKLSKVGTTDIPEEEFHVHARKRVWDDWQFFLERSPIYHASDSRTPLLILHGKDDPRVNPGQSRELYRHLKIRGQAPVRLVLYPGEGHGNRKAAARLDYSLRSLQWFEHYLAGPGGEPPPHDLDYASPSPADS
jgi:dipeptidyl aminopeptidase/acylaminoacyl peptidase